MADDQQPELGDPEQYVADIEYFIDRASIPDLVNQHLQTRFDNENPLPSS